MALEWYAVEEPIARTGLKALTYVQASSRQQAGESFLGAVVLGGPYATEADAEKAFPQGSAGSAPSHTGAPTVSDKPSDLSLPGWHFAISGISSWFFRGLKLLFGGILMIAGISKLTGLENKVTQATQLAISKTPVGAML